MNRSYESRLTSGVEKKFRKLENRIMEDVIRRIKLTGTITSSADYQLNRFYILGNSSEVIEDIVKKAVGNSFPETFELYDEVVESQYVRSKKLYEQVNQEYIPYEENLELQQLVAALIEQSNNDLYNITKSLGFQVDMGNGRKVFSPLSDYYNEYLDQAMIEITSGAFDYNTVIRHVVSQMTNSGLRTIEFSGKTSRCDVAARRALMTGISQLTARITEFNAAKLGTEYFEVDWHSGARPSHRVWQGKVWSKQQLIDVCGLGTGPGLLGWNCYHEYYPFFPGISERNYTDDWLEEQNRKEDVPKAFRGKEYTLYEATQRQRYLETCLRAQRQKVKLLQDAGADPDTVTLAQCKYQARLDEYAEFSRTMGLQEQRERIYYDLQGRIAPGQKAYENYLRKKSAATLAKKEKVDILELSEEEMGVLLQYKSFESYLVNDALRTSGFEGLDAQKKAFVETLDRALQKMKRYQGDLLRTVDFSDSPDQEALEAFLKVYIPDNVVIIPQYWSTSKSEGYNDSASVKIYISNAKHGRDISDIGLDEEEVLYERNTAFRVIRKVFSGGTWHILVEEAES